MERLLWRGTILLLRLFGDFPPVFLFGSKISAHSTKPAPLFLELAAGTGQHRPFHVLRCAFPHPLQNRVPRGAGHLWRSAAPVSAPRLGRCWALPTGEQHPRRQPRQVLLPLPQNRRKHWVFAGFLFARVVWEWGSLWFRHLVFPSVRTCFQPLPPPQAPKTHPTSAISPEIGCVSLFLPSFDLQKFRAGFSQTSGLSSHSYRFILTRPFPNAMIKIPSFVSKFFLIDSGIIVTHGHNAPQVKVICRVETNFEKLQRPAQPCGEIP